MCTGLSCDQICVHAFSHVTVCCEVLYSSNSQTVCQSWLQRQETEASLTLPSIRATGPAPELIPATVPAPELIPATAVTRCHALGDSTPGPVGIAMTALL